MPVEENNPRRNSLATKDVHFNERLRKHNTITKEKIQIKKITIQVQLYSIRIPLQQREIIYRSKGCFTWKTTMKELFSGKLAI